MPRTLVVPGDILKSWTGVEVWQRQKGRFVDITHEWSWPETVHQHYEVSVVAEKDGSYWVPASTHPPKVWFGETLIEGTTPRGSRPVNRDDNEYRPNQTYIWIPNGSIPYNYVCGSTTNAVVCKAPSDYRPDAGNQKVFSAPLASNAHMLLDSVMAATGDKDQSAFQDSDGLIGFVNLSSSFVTDNPEFKVGRDVCDKVSNFFSTLRIKVFGALLKDPSKVLPGDKPPKSQWDLSVTHYMQYMLTQAGGLTNYKITTETYSVTQIVAEFSTAFLKLIFDAAVVPEAVIVDVTNFIQGVGGSLRASWDDRSRNFETALLGQCHEAVQTDSSGKTTVYFPKIKYYHIKVDSSQQEFTSPCSSVKKITFNFKYEYYVTALKHTILDPTSKDYKDFVAFLDRAQGISYKQANNNLDQILEDTVSTPGGHTAAFALLSGQDLFGVNLEEYPRTVRTPPSIIETVLNQAARDVVEAG
ncbi:hypothetical protein SAMN04487926_11949 [Paraburkholderia steynii]|uniref:Virulence factor Evf domain-containing protein n=1 Tax=Paraburkholderia steynii TaxID=1245441 RepID=A0A7Z7BBD0_9BURK|nr:hypothetical protein [Paraburkholderia steynii]SDI55935.1 hypothetical protein SAMN04487926_11949 [Paraburkholderia steynii]